ncbi:MAG: RagB/SusD family nutrient uptake outer membrane protein [Muricauda sp.]|nr:RagB/SusD family nutrient uptake outer membrane protein [Allomuricauda sp.]MAU26958.1 RagB/SusD family nutrient uptake outer membrane protein [Allomuricauda sp.]MBC29995.1 RagB/SusD family nutrient uptake outer membrane protein [Allomuricauda sp.]|tara:strand:- start:90700 stop:92304 length:1605 start_codon:yes stop_codon:yes gene_type:complete
MKRNSFKIYLLTFLSVLGLASCTDLEIEETDSIIPETTSEGFTGVSDPASQVDGLYRDVYGQFGDQANLFALMEVSTDEQLVPTRGTDWGDNGIWRVLHSHTWSPTHQYILTVWNQFNQNVFRATEVIDPRSNAAPDVLANAKFIRALSMWVVLDLYGQVPFREVDEGPDVNPRVLSRTEAMDFAIADLEAAIPDLPSVPAGSGDENKRASKAAARYLLAKIYLNKHIYNGSGTPDTADMNKVISLVDEIAAEGYGLESGYFDIFRDSPDNETIWWLETSVGNRIFNGLHYNSTGISGGGWNGFSTLSEFYDLFEGDPNSNRGEIDGTPLDGQEERRGWVPSEGTPYTGAPGTTDNGGYEDGSNVGLGFLINQQYALDGTPLTDRPGNPLAFTRDFPALIGNNERTGIRVQKYAARYGAFTSHEILFRYADAHLMKAEAIMRNGGDPTSMVNELRSIRNATPLGTVTEQDLLDERGRELYVEFWRRNDLIRFGQFTRDWEFKNPASVGDETKTLYPIPLIALLSNPNLQQNPGY